MRGNRVPLRSWTTTTEDTGGAIMTAGCCEITTRASVARSDVVAPQAAGGGGGIGAGWKLPALAGDHQPAPGAAVAAAARHGAHAPDARQLAGGAADLEHVTRPSCISSQTSLVGIEIECVQQLRFTDEISAAFGAHKIEYFQRQNFAHGFRIEGAVFVLRGGEVSFTSAPLCCRQVEGGREGGGGCRGGNRSRYKRRPYDVRVPEKHVTQQART